MVAQCNVRTPTVELSAKQECTLNLDGETLHSILNHLIQNAQEATSSSGWVKVTMQVKVANVEITIEDNGCGMSQQFIEKRLFKPFDTTKGNAGMGIGVYEAKQFIESIAGTIKVASEEHKGTTFIVNLPINPVFEE